MSSYIPPARMDRLHARRIVADPVFYRSRLSAEVCSLLFTLAWGVLRADRRAGDGGPAGGDASTGQHFPGDAA